MGTFEFMFFAGILQLFLSFFMFVAMVYSGRPCHKVKTKTKERFADLFFFFAFGGFSILISLAVYSVYSLTF